MFDSHCHIYDSRYTLAHVNHILTTCKSSNILHLGVCTSNAMEWNQCKLFLLKSQTDPFPIIHPAFGIHPWYIEEDITEQIVLLKRLLFQFPTAGIGEIGICSKSSRSIEMQLNGFQEQFQLAAIANRYVVIHCVKYHMKLIQSITVANSLPPSIIFHSFSGSVEIMKQLLKLNTRVFFSFTLKQVVQKSTKTTACIQSVPLRCLLIETDAPDQNPYGQTLNEPNFISSGFLLLGEIKQMKEEELIPKLVENFADAFQI